MVGDDVSPDHRPPAEPPSPPDEAVLDPALRLLSVRSRSVKELRDRLLRKNLDPEAVETCVCWLSHRRLLDDEAFAEAVVRDRIQLSPRSPFLLARELVEKGVSRTTAQKAVARIFDEEGLEPEELSARVARAWVRKQSPSTRKALLAEAFDEGRDRARRRLLDFLARRGFVGDAALRGVQEAEEDRKSVV